MSNNNRLKGQATTELAILGSIILLILGAMLRYSQTISASQQMQVYAFNKAVKFAEGRAQANHMGRVSFTANQDIYPVDLTGFHAQGTNVQGSATVLYDPEMSFYTGEDREDYGKNYTQVGRDMIAKNEVIEFPQIKVTRQNDGKGKSAWWENVLDTIFGSASSSEVQVWESAPVESAVEVKGPQGVDLEQDWGGVTYVKDLYKYQPLEVITVSRNEDASGIGGTKVAQRKEQSLQRYYLKTDSQIKADDPGVISVDEGTQGDLFITNQKTVTKEKEWQTPQ